MKQSKINKFFAFLLGFAFILVAICPTSVSAGSSDIVLDSSTYEPELDNSVWNNPDGDLLIQNGTITFPVESTEYTRLITKTAVQGTKEIDELVNISTRLNFTQLPEGERFVIALGVKRIESMQGDKGNIEVSFSNQGGLQVSVIYFEENDAPIVLAEPKSAGSLTNSNLVEIAVNTNQTMTVAVNSYQLFSVELPISGEGRIGFLQSGNCGVTLKDIRIVSHLYDSPQNCDILEDFESSSFNANLLSAKMRGASYVCWPSGTAIEEYNGSMAFGYTNAGESYIATKYMYSNFEMSFDVPYLQRKNIIDENGNLTTSISNHFGISYGGEACDFDYAGYTDAVTDVLWFNTNSHIVSMKTGENANVAEKGIPFFSKDSDRGFSVKVAMQDSIVTVWMKWLDETVYTEVFRYQLSTRTPTGYLHIWTDGPTNLAIDNLKIINTDINPNLVDVEYRSSIIEDPGDYVYQPTPKVYAAKSEETTTNYNWIIPSVFAVCGICIVTVICLAVMRNKRRKEVANCEA